MEADLRREIREAVKNGMSHRAAAATFGVSLRQVQNAVNLLKRRMQDISYYRRNVTKYREWRKARYWKDKQDVDSK